MNPEIFGSIAAILTTAAYVPQTIKVFREKNTKSISLGMYALISMGLFCWMVYGFQLGSPSLVIANGLTFVMAVAILFMKIKLG